jgi:hypothetical protein
VGKANFQPMAGNRIASKFFYFPGWRIGEEDALPL